MTIANVLISQSIDTARQVVNQLSANINQIISLRYATTGGLNISTPNAQFVALNVTAGMIKGNGAGLFSLKFANVSGTFLNSQLQNSNIVVTGTTGVFGGGTLVLGSSISLNIAAVDSITNTRTDLPASTNSAGWALQSITTLASNASIVNVGLLSVSAGGTGLPNTYQNGQILLGNSMSGGLKANVILAGAGIIATYGPGTFSFSANLIQGQNVTFSYPDLSSPSRIVIGANSVPISAAPLQAPGLVLIEDSVTSMNVDRVASANSVNACHRLIVTNFGTSRAPNALSTMTIYTQPGTYVWSPKASTDWIEVTVIGHGAAGRLSNTVAGGIGGAGGGGAYIEAKLSLAQLHAKTVALGGASGNTQNIVIGSLSYVGASSNQGGTCTFGQFAAGNLWTAQGGSLGTQGYALSNVDFGDTSGGAGGHKIISGLLLTDDTTYSGGGQGYEWFLAVSGQGGGNAVCYGANNIIAGKGGNSGMDGTLTGLGVLLGRGGQGGVMDQHFQNNAPGGDGIGYGSGGGGSCTRTGSAVNGGNGAPGFVIVREYLLS